MINRFTSRQLAGETEHQRQPSGSQIMSEILVVAAAAYRDEYSASPHKADEHW